MRIFLLFSILILSVSSFSQPLSSPRKPASVFDLPKYSESEIIIGDWALLVAKEFDSTIDIESKRAELDEAAEEIKRMIAGRKRDIDKFLAIRTYIYESGAWNNYQIFSYDLDDPFGKKLKNQLITSYLESKKGNCVSMPTLFISLAERVDPELKIVGIHAPQHLLVRFNDRQSKDSWNVETTNGATPSRNQFLIETLKISQKALDNQIYLKELSKKEYVSFLITILASREVQAKKYDKALKYLDLVLEVCPNNISAIVKKASCFSWLGYEYKERLDARNIQLTEIDHDILTGFKEDAKYFTDQAFSLGWSPPDKESDDEYLKVIEKQKSEREKK